MKPFVFTSLRELVHEIGKGQGESETSVPNMGEMPQCWKAAEGMVYFASPQAVWSHPPSPSILGNGTELSSGNKLAFPNFGEITLTELLQIQDHKRDAFMLILSFTLLIPVQILVCFL